MEKTISAIKQLGRYAARSYTAGLTFQDAWKVHQRVGARGMQTTLCYWNQGTDQPEAIATEYLRILDAIGSAPCDTYLSVKLTALRFNYDLLQQIIERAQRSGIRVHFDSMAYDTADATFSAIEFSRTIHKNLSCTIPARWARSRTDILRAVDMGVRVRIVKGEWADTNDAVPDIRSAFIDLVDVAACTHATVAIASHDLDLARESVRRLKSAGCSCEIELLYGLPMDSMLTMAGNEGLPVRIYVPYGQTGLPYTLKEAVHNPKIIGRFVRDLLQSGDSKHTQVIGGPAGVDILDEGRHRTYS